MQGQLVLVSRGDAASAPSRDALLRALDSARSPSAADLVALSALALVRPGVDGDVAGIVSCNTEVEAVLVGSLRSAARDADLDCDELPEAAFARRLGAST
jgi:hypothetical protein